MTIDYSKYEGHTAGPWHIDGIRVQSNESGWIRVVAKAVRQQCRTDREAVANANLIADAPLLLKRCRELEAELHEAKRFQQCVAVATENGTCLAFRDADGFRQ